MWQRERNPERSRRTRRGRRDQARRLAIAAVAALVPAGCVSEQSRVENSEQMLVAAGFVEKPATSPERQQQLATLKPYKVLRQPVQVNGQDTFGYLYADPQYCHCVLTGDARAYQVYQQLAQQQKLAEERLEAEELAQEEAFDWGAWGPYGYWGGPPVVVVPRR